MQRAQEAMTRHLVSLTPEHRIYHAMEAMERFRIRHIPIFGDDGWVGIVSDRDLRKHISERFQMQEETVEDRVAMTRQLDEVMTKDLIYVTPDKELEDIMDVMTAHQISSVLVRDDRSEDILGIITQTDVTRSMKELLAGKPPVRTYEEDVDWLISSSNNRSCRS